MKTTPISVFRLSLALIALMLAAAPARAAEKYTVLLDWFVNPDHAPLIVAHETGYFREAGLDVEFVAPANPNDPPKLVAAGRAALAVSYQTELHVQVSAGLPVARIATLIATPLNSLVVLDKSPIRTLADLKGKTVGYSIAATVEVLLKTMLKNAGLEIDDVTMVNVSFALSPALISGKVDAILGAFRNFELNQLAIEGVPGRAFFPEEHGVPAYDELILIANRKTVGDPRLRRFVDALERGVQYLLNHPDESWRLFVKGRKELDDELNRHAWRDTLPRFALRPAALDRARYARFAAFLEEIGMVKDLPALESYAVELP